jgi:(S)-ureidoglycine aminohydrolase
MSPTYRAPEAGLPPQTALHTGRAVFTEAYAVLPRGVLRDIVASRLPGWTDTRLWVLARPMTGFAETFSQYLMEVAPGGGAQHGETEPGVEGALFVLEGAVTLALGHELHTLGPGGFAYIPPDMRWALSNGGDAPARFHWIRKRYAAVEGVAAPDPIVAQEAEVAPIPMPDTDGRWATTRFVDSDDLRHDMHVTIVTFEPGGVIPFAETHVMEHGLYVLEGKAVYRLNQRLGGGRGRATSCGCAPSARRPATPAGRGGSAICSTRTSTATRRSGR